MASTIATLMPAYAHEGYLLQVSRPRLPVKEFKADLNLSGYLPNAEATVAMQLHQGEGTDGLYIIRS